MGVGVKFVEELLEMGIRMTLHVKHDNIIIKLELRNAYNAIWRAVILDRYKGRVTLTRSVPY